MFSSGRNEGRYLLLAVVMSVGNQIYQLANYSVTRLETICHIVLSDLSELWIHATI